MRGRTNISGGGIINGNIETLEVAPGATIPTGVFVSLAGSIGKIENLQNYPSTSASITTRRNAQWQVFRPVENRNIIVSNADTRRDSGLILILTDDGEEIFRLAYNAVIFSSNGNMAVMAGERKLIIPYETHTSSNSTTIDKAYRNFRIYEFDENYNACVLRNTISDLVEHRYEETIEYCAVKTISGNRFVMITNDFSNSVKPVSVFEFNDLSNTISPISSCNFGVSDILQSTKCDIYIKDEHTFYYFYGAERKMTSYAFYDDVLTYTDAITSRDIGYLSENRVTLKNNSLITLYNSSIFTAEYVDSFGEMLFSQKEFDADDLGGKNIGIDVACFAITDEYFCVLSLVEMTGGKFQLRSHIFKKENYNIKFINYQDVLGAPKPLTYFKITDDSSEYADIIKRNGMGFCNGELFIAFISSNESSTASSGYASSYICGKIKKVEDRYLIETVSSKYATNYNGLIYGISSTSGNGGEMINVYVPRV